LVLGTVEIDQASPPPSVEFLARDPPYLAIGDLVRRSSLVVIDRLSRCLRQFELNGSACFLLSDSRSIRGIAIRRDIINFEGHEIATTELAIDSEVEERKVPNAAFDLKLSSDRPNVLGAKRRLCPDDLPFIPGDVLRAEGT
jgi:hypothetical protein